MVTEEKVIQKGTCKNCIYYGTTRCPDILLMDNLDPDTHRCVQYEPKKQEEEE